MEAIKKDKHVQVSRQNISYYNEIAADYDAILNKDAANTIIRAKVAATFTRHVKKDSSVLDFGGGTGQDLDWLLQYPYHVYFCEPSAAMRAIAMERIRNKYPRAGISFFTDHQADFRNWVTAFPAKQPVDAVLADFAVVNCIPDIKLLFEKLALAVRPGGKMIALILENGIAKRLKSNLKGTLRSFFSGKPVTIYVDYNGQRQLVYLHSTSAIKKASAGYFECSHVERLEGLGFCLLQLARK
jgi:SAM-dependent methyltransferase